MIGIIGAMEEEIIQLKNCMEDAERLHYASMDFYKGRMYGRELVVVRSGIGKVNAAVCAQVLVDVFHVKQILNTGIAGSLDARIHIGDIVLSADALQHDVDARAFGYPVGVIPRMERSIFPADEELAALAKAACQKVNADIQVYIGRIVSGDQFIADQDKKGFIKENFNPLCTEMEGAAIAHVAYLNHVPFLIIRAISDQADDSAQVDYKVFEAAAIQAAVRLLKELVQKIKD